MREALRQEPRRSVCPGAVDLPRPGTASEHPDGLGLLCGERLGFELGIDGQRRECENLNRADHALVARFTARW